MMYTKSLGLLLAALIVTGCADKGTTDAPKSETAQQPEKKNEVASKEEHAPHGSGPNGGVVFDLGKYHAEFTVDHPKHECMILFIGNDEKTPVAVTAKELTLTTKETKTKEGKVVPPMTVKLFPQDETDGKATKFLGTDPGIGNVADFEGTVLGEVDGKPSQGEFKE
ncbi:hypothetical protein [uncultured Gimesia sp.]|uniref:hypothetical protein n=1 Tax=uncultured Gimesia sp. TaxID=1678688 RepID=UPI0030D89B7F